MFSFPRDQERRNIWCDLSNRGGGWAPNNYSVLCQVKKSINQKKKKPLTNLNKFQDHFNDDDLEIRNGGVIRLKSNAVPTHFKIIGKSSQRKIPKMIQLPPEKKSSLIKILKPEELNINAMQIVINNPVEKRKSPDIKLMKLKRSSQVKTYSQNIRPNSALNRIVIKKEVVAPSLKIVDQKTPQEYIKSLVASIVDLQSKLEQTEALNSQMNSDLAQYVKVAEELSKSEAFYRNKYKSLRAKMKLDNVSDISDDDE